MIAKRYDKLLDAIFSVLKLLYFLQSTVEPVMTAYKLVTVQFKWWGLQDRVENFIHTTEKRLFTNFHRQVINIVRMAEIIMTVQVFCWMDKWHGMTMEDIRALEEETKNKLDEERSKVNTILNLNVPFSYTSPPKI